MPDVPLLFTKMEYIFQQKQPQNDDFMNYIQCLTAAQNEMLQLIYDPRNKFVAMEENPLDSKDLMHGVPRIFRSIFDDITQSFEQGIEEFFEEELGFERINEEEEHIDNKNNMQELEDQSDNAENIVNNKMDKLFGMNRDGPSNSMEFNSALRRDKRNRSGTTVMKPLVKTSIEVDDLEDDDVVFHQ